MNAQSIVAPDSDWLRRPMVQANEIDTNIKEDLYRYNGNIINPVTLRAKMEEKG